MYVPSLFLPSHRLPPTNRANRQITGCWHKRRNMASQKPRRREWRARLDLVQALCPPLDEQSDQFFFLSFFIFFRSNFIPIIHISITQGVGGRDGVAATALGGSGGPFFSFFLFSFSLLSTCRSVWKAFGMGGAMSFFPFFLKKPFPFFSIHTHHNVFFISSRTVILLYPTPPLPPPTFLRIVGKGS